MRLIKSLTQKEFHNPAIDGLIGGIGDGIGELLYNWAEAKSMRSIFVSDADLGPISRYLNRLDGRAHQLRAYYSDKFEKSKKYAEDHRTLWAYYNFERITRESVKVLGFIPLLFALPFYYSVSQRKTKRKNKEIS